MNSVQNQNVKAGTAFRKVCAHHVNISEASPEDGEEWLPQIPMQMENKGTMGRHL